MLLTILAGLVGGLFTLIVILRAIPVCWLRAHPHGSLDQADYFAVFALGLGRDATGRETAGASNEALANWLLANNPHRKPTLVQEGIYLALQARERKQPDLELARWVWRIPHNPNVNVDTIGATLHCCTLAAARGLSRPAVVAHDLQQQRMAWLFHLVYGIDRVVVPALPEIPFDPTSVQHWGTRSPRGWVTWELLLARPAMGVYGAAIAIFLGGLVGATAVGLLVNYLTGAP